MVKVRWDGYKPAEYEYGIVLIKGGLSSNKLPAETKTVPLETIDAHGKPETVQFVKMTSIEPWLRQAATGLRT